MIVVTGTFRSGTSLMMQTLQKLGINIAGNEFDVWNKKEFNPRGYWELPVKEVVEGVKSNKYEGQGVKLFVQGLTKTNPNLISRAIRCTRWKRAAVISFMKLLQASPNCGIPGTRNVCDQLYDVHHEFVETYLDTNNIPYINVDFEDMLRDPKKQISRIVKLLGLKTDTKLAIENVGL